MIEHFYNNHRNQIDIEEDCYDSDENNKEDFAFNDKIYENAVESPKNEFNSNCKLYEMRVPFQLVPELVATRSVILRKGFFRCFIFNDSYFGFDFDIVFYAHNSYLCIYFTEN